VTYLVRSLELILKHLRGPLPSLAAGQKPFLTTGTFNLFFKDRSTIRLGGAVSRERKPPESSLPCPRKLPRHRLLCFERQTFRTYRDLLKPVNPNCHLPFGYASGRSTKPELLARTANHAPAKSAAEHRHEPTRESSELIKDHSGGSCDYA